ncbi:MAG: PAS domain S-box protein [Prevotella sp.]|nr:PAS domain S-box protein [Prevotella sp.]
MSSSNRLRLLAVAALSTISLTVLAQKENMETIADPHHLSAYFVAALMISVFVMIFSNRLFYYRQREVSTRAQRLNSQLGLVLTSNKTQVWTYDFTKRIYTVLSSKEENRKTFTPIDFAQFFNNNEFAQLHKTVISLSDSQEDPDPIVINGSTPEDNSSPRIYKVHLTALQRDKNGKAKLILGTQRDITENRQRKEKARNLALRYHTIFNSSLVDMIYYGADGQMTDINDKACETFGITDREALMKRKVKITDIPSYRNLDFDHLENLQMSSITDIDRTKREDERIPELTASGMFYYECAVSAVRDKNEQLLGIIAAGRDITDMVDSHHRQQQDALLLEKRTKDIQDYINNINYSLKVSGVRLVNYHPDNHELKIYSDLNQIQYSLSQIRCASLLALSDQRKARGLMLRMDRRTPGNFTATVQTRFHDEQGRNIFLTFSMVPVEGKDGLISHYFGMLRNDTEMVYTERQLMKETEKAQETEELKNTFLLNMSYEIRTPLNAVIGFAELFNGPHEVEDEPIFSEEIKRNTNELLALVNDILYISRLDAKMVEFNYKETDFATLFEGFCYMGLGTLNPDVKIQVENPYNHLMVKIDEQNLGEVIQKLCINAARVTKAGTIRAKYDYRHGELNISIEDTGRGLSEKDLQHVFDRFARDENNQREGTGLDMPIIRELVEQMGGTIEVQSEEGKGSTAYVIIPCEMTAMEKKTEIII